MRGRRRRTRRTRSRQSRAHEGVPHFDIACCHANMQQWRWRTSESTSTLYPPIGRLCGSRPNVIQFVPTHAYITPLLGNVRRDMHIRHLSMRIP